MPVVLLLLHLDSTGNRIMIISHDVLIRLRGVHIACANSLQGLFMRRGLGRGLKLVLVCRFLRGIVRIPSGIFNEVLDDLLALLGLVSVIDDVQDLLVFRRVLEGDFPHITGLEDFLPVHLAHRRNVGQ